MDAQACSILCLIRCSSIDNLSQVLSLIPKRSQMSHAATFPACQWYISRRRLACRAKHGLVLGGEKTVVYKLLVRSVFRHTSRTDAKTKLSGYPNLCNHDSDVYTFLNILE